MITAKLDIPVVMTVGVEINIADCDAEVATLIKNRLESVIPEITKPIVVGDADVALTDAAAPEQPVTAKAEPEASADQPAEQPAEPAKKRGRPKKNETAEPTEPATETHEEPKPESTDTDIDPDGALLSHRVSVGSYVACNGLTMITARAHRITEIEFGRQRAKLDNRLQWLTFDDLNKYWRLATPEEIEAAYPECKQQEQTEPEPVEQPEPQPTPEPTKELLDYDPECCVNAQALAEGPGSGCRECNGCGRFDEDKPTDPESVVEPEKPGLFDTLKPGDWIRVNSDRGKPYKINNINGTERSVSLAERGTVFADDINESWILTDAPHDYFPGDMIRHKSDIPKSVATLPDAATITKVSEKVILTNNGEILRSVVDAEYDVLSDAEAFGTAKKAQADAPESPATDLDAMFAAATEPNDDDGDGSEPVPAGNPHDFLT